MNETLKNSMVQRNGQSPSSPGGRSDRENVPPHQFPIKEAKLAHGEDPYVYPAHNPDFVATRPDLIGRTDLSPPLPANGTGLPHHFGGSPAKITGGSPPVGIGQGIGDPDGDGLSISQAAALKVRSGLSDLRSKLSHMKQQKEKAEREMLKELDEYHRRKRLEQEMDGNMS